MVKMIDRKKSNEVMKYSAGKQLAHDRKSG